MSAIDLDALLVGKKWLVWIYSGVKRPRGRLNVRIEYGYWVAFAVANRK
jgi:hypothetical protein